MLHNISAKNKVVILQNTNRGGTSEAEVILTQKVEVLILQGSSLCLYVFKV